MANLFEPERTARSLMTLYPDQANEIVLAFIDDALAQGDAARAVFWRDVMGALDAMKASPGNTAPSGQARRPSDPAN